MPGAGPRAVASGSHARSRSRRERRGSAFQLFVAIPGIRPTRREPAQYPSSASTAAAGSGGPNIAAPVDYATLLDREQAAFDAAEFTPATADPDAPLPDVGVGSAQNPLVVQLRNLRRRSWLSRVRGSRWSGTDAELVTAYNAEKTKAQARRRRAAQTAPCVYDAYARRVPISAPS